MPIPPADRLRWLVYGLGCLAFVLASIWILMHPERGGRGVGIAGLLFFGLGGVVMLWSALKGKAFPQRARRQSAHPLPDPSRRTADHASGLAEITVRPAASCGVAAAVPPLRVTSRRRSGGLGCSPDRRRPGSRVWHFGGDPHGRNAQHQRRRISGRVRDPCRWPRRAGSLGRAKAAADRVTSRLGQAFDHLPHLGGERGRGRTAW